MGLIGKLLSFVRGTDEGNHITDVQADPGAGANITAQHFGPPGVDSHPLRDDFVVCVPSGGNGTEAAVGYLDVKNEPQAAAGETRLYARDSNGNVKAIVWLKNDGTVRIEAVGGAVVEVRPDGSVYLAGNAAKLTRDDRLQTELAKIVAAFGSAQAPVGGGQVTYTSPYTTPGTTAADKVHGT